MRTRLHRFLLRFNLLTLRHRPGHVRLVAGSLGLALVLGVVAILASRDGEPSTPDFGSRVPGQRIYDQTGLLNSTDLVSLDQRAAAIEQSGVPVVVYIRSSKPDADDTRADARALMRSWGVESGPGADDGLVLFLDLDRLDVDADHVALIPGDRLKDNRLPIGETERISAGSVQGLTTTVDTSRELAATITFNLAATERRLLLGLPSAPAPSAAERTAATFARYLMPILSVVLAVMAALVIAMIWRGRPQLVMGASCDPPRPDSPVLRAALAANRIDQSVLIAAIRRLEGQGAVSTVLRPPSSRPEHLPESVRLLDRDLTGDDLDRVAWDDLATVANDGVVDQHGLTLVAHRNGAFSQSLVAELERRGWWDAQSAHRAVPLVMMSQGLLLAGGVTLVIALAVGEIWGVFAIALLTLTAAVAWFCAQTYPRATPLGLAVARERGMAEGG